MRFSGYYTILEAAEALSVTYNVVCGLLTKDFFRGAVKRGVGLWLIPTEDVARAASYLKKPLAQRVQILHSDPELVLSGDAARLIGIRPKELSRLRRRGVFPAPCGRVESGAHYYRMEDIIECAQANNMWWDRELAKKLRHSAEDDLCPDDGFTPIVQGSTH